LGGKGLAKIKEKRITLREGHEKILIEGIFRLHLKIQEFVAHFTPISAR